MPWDALVLAAGRGQDDPMAKAFGVTHKCLLPVAGVPMLTHVVAALKSEPVITRIAISIERDAPLPQDLPEVVRLASRSSAAESALDAVVSGALNYPVLVTTG